MENPSHRVPASQVRAAVLADTQARIAAHGWTVVGVFGTAEEPGPSFAYTVGLSAKELPELAIYGLPAQVAHSVLNELARRMVAAGAGLVTGDVIEGVLVGEVPLMAVAMSDARDLNLVRECYGAVAAAVQVCGPTLTACGRGSRAAQCRWMSSPCVGAHRRRGRCIALSGFRLLLPLS